LLEIVHHVLGIVMVLGFATQERGMHGFITGCILMEGANFFMNMAAMWRFKDTRKLMHLICVMAITASHVASAYLTYLTFITKSDSSNIYFFVFFVLSSVGVMYVRHDLNYQNYVRVCKEENSEKRD
jgi:hypothetical protein